MDYLDDKRLLATEPKHELTVLAAILNTGGTTV
jgi:hypothetical protein